VNLKLKIPEPEENEEILGAPATQPEPIALKAATALAALSGLPAQTDADPTPVTSLTEQLADEAGASLKAMVDQVAALAAKAESLEALRDQLLESYGDLDSSSLTCVMALAFAASDLSGRFDVSEEK